MTIVVEFKILIIVSGREAIKIQGWSTGEKREKNEEQL